MEFFAKNSLFCGLIIYQDAKLLRPTSTYFR